MKRSLVLILVLVMVMAMTACDKGGDSGSGGNGGTVSPADVKAKVSELMSGHESDYKHVTFDEYSKIFE